MDRSNSDIFTFIFQLTYLSGKIIRADFYWKI